MHRRRSRWQERRWPPTPTCALSQPPEKKKIKLSCKPGKGKKSLGAFQLVPDSGLQCHIPRLTPTPRAARRWALPPLHFLERWEAGLPPVHFCGRNSHLSTAEHTERMAATPLRPRHRCEAHTNPHHSWRQRKPCVKISHPLVDGADTTRLVEKPFLGNGARMQASGGPCRAPRTSEPSSSPRSSAEARGCAA